MRYDYNYYYAYNQTLIEQWNGKIWKVAFSPNPGSQSNVLLGVATVSASDIWAAGSMVNYNTAQQTLTERYK